MCSPTLIALAVSAAVSVTTTSVSAANQTKAGKNANKVSKWNQDLKNAQIGANNQQASEAAAHKAFDASRKFQLARAASQNSGLGDNSIRAIGRSLGFELGQDKTTLERNQELANQAAGYQIYGVDLTRESEQVQIGDTSGSGLAASIGLGVVGAAASVATGLADDGFFDKPPTDDIPETKTASASA